MKLKNKATIFWVGVTLAASVLALSSPAKAVDDGARSYWKGRSGTNVVSVQYLFLDMQSNDSQMVDPSHFIFPNTDAEADLFVASYARHFTLFDRPSSFAVNILGGSADVDIDATAVPSQFLPPGYISGLSFSQSATGFGDPTIQLDVNLVGTPPLISTVDLVNYEPSFTIDAAVMAAVPIGEYDGNSLVNIGQNRMFGRVALPMKYHFGTFAPGFMRSIELTPSVWLFGENDDFLGQNMENDPLWQLEGHVTWDFTRTFYGSLDLLYRTGFQSEINGVTVGDEIEIGDLGFTLNYQVTDNLGMRASYSSNLFGDDSLDSSLVRLQLVYGWHRLTENIKKLTK